MKKIILSLLLIIIFKDMSDGNELVVMNKTLADQWAIVHGAIGLKNNMPYTKVKFSGNEYKDFAGFVMGQGGGKSKDPYDYAVKGNPNGWPPEADADGNKYHTVHDMTWQFYKQWAPMIGITPTSANFYGMTDATHTNIVKAFIDTTIKQHKVKSIPCAMALAYASWGSGYGDGVYGNLRYDRGSTDLIDMFSDTYFMTIDSACAVVGEKITFSLLMIMRREQMKGSGDWNRCGTGWSSGLAHFYKLFINYCVN